MIPKAVLNCVEAALVDCTRLIRRNWGVDSRPINDILIPMARRIIGILLFLVFAGEVLIAFHGDYSFTRKPSLIVAPIYASGLEARDVDEIRSVLERQIALTGTQTIYPKSLIENFYLERDNTVDAFDGAFVGHDEALELGKALGVERVALVSIIRYSDRWNVSITIFDVATDQKVCFAVLETAGFDALLRWRNREDEPLDLLSAMDISVPGFGTGAKLYLGWLSVLLILAAFLLLGDRPPRIVLECLIAVGVLLALFSWIYALNGDMDYVQRFVATSGLLRIEDTSHERIATVLRYAAPLLLLGVLWWLDARERIKRRPANDGGGVGTGGGTGLGGGLPSGEGTSDRIGKRRNAAAASGVVLETTAPLWAALSAFLYSLALPNFLVLEGIPVLAWVATAPLYMALREVRFGRGVFLLMLFTGLQSLMINWWQGTFSYVSLPFTVALMLVQYIPFALLLAMTVRCFPAFGLLAAPLFWTMFDWTRSLGFLGYPWGLLGVSQYAHPVLIQSAALGGVWMVSVLPHLTGAVLAAALGPGKTSRGTIPPEMKRGMSLRSVQERVKCGIKGRTPFHAVHSPRRMSVSEETAALPRRHRTVPDKKGILPRRLIRPGKEGPSLCRLILPGAALAVILLIALAGSLTIRIRDARKEVLAAQGGRTVRILAVQQNTDPRKHDYQLSFDELSRLTEEALAEEGPFDLVAWPESGFTPDVRFWLDEKRSRWRRGKLVRSFLDWQAETEVPLVTGTQDHFFEKAASDKGELQTPSRNGSVGNRKASVDSAGSAEPEIAPDKVKPSSVDSQASLIADEPPEEIKRIQNSAMYLPPHRTGDGEREYYYKIHLVPFTENFPFREEFPRVAELLHNFSTTQWTPGTEHIVFQAPAFRFSTPICFEDVFPDHLRRFASAGAEVFVNMSNDYWANTPLEGYQHAAHAVFRTVENRRPLIRATCSGWTISVDTEGRIAPDRPDFYTPGRISADFLLPAEPEVTLYGRWGDWFPIFCGIFWFFLLISEALLRGAKRRDEAGSVGVIFGADSAGADFGGRPAGGPGHSDSVVESSSAQTAMAGGSALNNNAENGLNRSPSDIGETPAQTAEERLWWKHGVLYQIYPRSFSDSDGDGIGDLAGLTGKLDYLRNLGVDGLWLSPIYPSPMADFGYDISDYRGIDPVFGDLEDFRILVEEAHRRGIRMIMDMVFNHSSDRHPWFLESRSSKSSPKRDWYVWHPGRPSRSKGGRPRLPNNWRGAFGGPAWSWDENTGEYYLHSFLPEQPDLNWHNPEVREELYNVLRFWMEIGVDGFRFDVINYIAKDRQFRNNPYRIHKALPRRFEQQNHIFDRCRPESHLYLKELRKVLDEYPERMSVGEVFPNEGIIDQKASAAYLGDAESDGEKELHMAFDFSPNFAPWSASYFARILGRQYEALEAKGWPVHVLSNHDQSRSAARLAKGNPEKIKLLLTLLLTQRGTPFLYYGEEIGMTDVKIPRAALQDPVGIKFWPFHPGRDPERTPMQWNGEERAGFTDGKPWLPIPESARCVNVGAQENDPDSILSHTRSLIALRRERASLNRGSWELLPSERGVLAYRRKCGEEETTVYLNFSRRRQTMPVSEGEVILLDSLRRIEGRFRNFGITDETITVCAYQSIITGRRIS